MNTKANKMENTEIERKFLVLSDAYKAVAESRSEIVQAYLMCDDERSLRVRMRGGKGFITFKAEMGGAKELETHTYDLTEEGLSDVIGFQNYQQLQEEYPNLSLGTVYRNLNQLSEEHVIRRVGVINGQERFDADIHPHAHFVCNRCGAVLDLPDYAPSRHYIQSLSEQYEFIVEGHEFNLRGLCQDCKKNIALQ